MPGLLFIVAAPSGAGKTTLVRHLLAQEKGVCLSISYTTRPPRPGEEHGREYHFVDEARFKSMVAAGDFLEWAEVHGNYYGTSRRWIEKECSVGHDVLLEIDWQGAQQVRRAFPESIGIFLLPPSLKVLQERLTGRGTDSAEVIARRLAAAQEEMRHVDEFGYVIINGDLQTALTDFTSVVRASRLRLRTQRRRHMDLFTQLTNT